MGTIGVAATDMDPDTPLSRRRLLRSGATVGALALAGCGTLGGSDGGETTTDGPAVETATETDTPTATPDPQTPTALLAERIDDGTVGMMLEQVLQQRQLASRQAGNGNTFIVARFTVKNLTEDWFLPTTAFDSFTLVGSDGEEYGRVPAPVERFSQFNGGQIAPGEVVRGYVAFEAPSDISSPAMEVAVDHDRITFTRPRFRMDARADAVSLLTQDLAVPVHSVGESVTDGDIEVTLLDYRTQASVGSVGSPEGYSFVVPTVRIRNRTGEDALVNVTSQLLIKDGTGSVYNTGVRAHSQLDEPLQWTQSVEAGKYQEGPVPYLVSEAVEETLFVFDYVGLGDRYFWLLE